MKYKDPVTGEWKEIYSKTADTLPVGTVVEFEGEEVPAGWEEVIEEENPKGVVFALASVLNTEFKLSSSSKIPLDSLTNDSNLDYFKIENNNIVINSDKIKKIEVSGNIFINGPTGTGYVWGQIRRNNGLVSGTIMPYVNAGGFLGVAIPPRLFNVIKGDTFSLVGDSTVQGTVRKDFPNTWLYIKVLEWKEV